MCELAVVRVGPFQWDFVMRFVDFTSEAARQCRRLDGKSEAAKWVLGDLTVRVRRQDGR